MDVKNKKIYKIVYDTKFLMKLLIIKNIYWYLYDNFNEMKVMNEYVLYYV